MECLVCSVCFRKANVCTATFAMKLPILCFLAIWSSLLLAAFSKDVRNVYIDEKQKIEESEPEEREIEEREPEDKMLDKNESERRGLREERGLEISQPEERETITRGKLDSYMEKHDKSADLMNLGKTALESIGSFAKIDYNQSAEAIAWEVAGAIVPIISAALALIPGVGVLLSGLFSGLWGVISSIFAPQKENPMEIMIKQLSKRMDDKLTNIINLAIHGEISRNVYICNKYNYSYQNFADKFKSKTLLDPLDATNLKIYLNDCDNFLKDTAEAFVYDEYAEVLWVPGAITTSVRLGFLAELVRNGHFMRLTDDVIGMYHQELRKDTKRQFEYYSKGLKNVNDRRKEEYYADRNIDFVFYYTDYLKDISAIETAACSLQSQLLYFDRLVYPYGMPKVLTNFDMFNSIKTTDYYNATEFEKTKVKHLQVFFNVTESKFATLPVRDPTENPLLYMNKKPYYLLEHMNCFMGPMYQRAPSVFYFNFEFVKGEGKYSYEFRVMYLEKKTTDKRDATYKIETVPILHEMKKGGYGFNEYEDAYKAINKRTVPSGRKCLGIYFMDSNHSSAKENGQNLVDVSGWSRWKKCPYMDYHAWCCTTNPCPYNEHSDYHTCIRFVSMFQGRFKIHSAGIYNHGGEKLSPLIAIGNPEVDYTPTGWDYLEAFPNGFLVGMEIIVRPWLD